MPASYVETHGHWRDVIAPCSLNRDDLPPLRKDVPYNTVSNGWGTFSTDTAITATTVFPLNLAHLAMAACVPHLF